MKHYLTLLFAAALPFGLMTPASAEARDTHHGKHDSHRFDRSDNHNHHRHHHQSHRVLRRAHFEYHNHHRVWVPARWVVVFY